MCTKQDCWLKHVLYIIELNARNKVINSIFLVWVATPTNSTLETIRLWLPTPTPASLKLFNSNSRVWFFRVRLPTSTPGVQVFSTPTPASDSHVKNCSTLTPSYDLKTGKMQTHFGFNSDSAPLLQQTTDGVFRIFLNDTVSSKICICCPYTGCSIIRCSDGLKSIMEQYYGGLVMVTTYTVSIRGYFYWLGFCLISMH